MGCNLFIGLFFSRFRTNRPKGPISDQRFDESALITNTREQCKRYAYNATKLTKKISIQLIMNPPWRTQLENAFSWMGGLRPSIILQLFDAALQRGLVTDEGDENGKTCFKNVNNCFQSHQNYSSYFQNVLKECQDMEEKVETRLKDCQINPNPCPAQKPCWLFQHPRRRKSTEEWKEFPTILALLDGTFERRAAALKALKGKINRFHLIVEDAFDLRFQIVNAIARIPTNYRHQVGTFIKLLHLVGKAFRFKGLRLLWPNDYSAQQRERSNAGGSEQEHRFNQLIECERKLKAEEELEQKAKANQDRQTQQPDINNPGNNNNNNTVTPTVFPGFVNAAASVPIVPMHPFCNNNNPKNNSNNNITATTTIPGFANAAANIPIMSVYPSVNLQMPNTNNFVFPSSTSIAALHPAHV